MRNRGLLVCQTPGLQRGAVPIGYIRRANAAGHGMSRRGLGGSHVPTPRRTGVSDRPTSLGGRL